MDIVAGQAATDGVSIVESLLCSSGMTSSLVCCGESVFQMLAQNKAILSWRGDSGTTTARAIVGAVGVLFNDALNTFYLRLYGVRNMVKDHWDSER